MSNNIDIKTLEAFQDGNHKAFETIFIAYYNKTKTFIDGYIKSEPDAEELWFQNHTPFRYEVKSMYPSFRTISVRQGVICCRIEKFFVNMKTAYLHQ